MNQIFECPHCGVITAIPQDDYFEGFCESCSTDFYAVVEPEQEESEVSMSINANSPAGATNTNEGNEQSAKRSVHTLYLLKNSNSTRDTFGTWGGEDIPRDKYFPVLIECDAVAEIWNDSTGQITFNTGCIEAMTAEATKRREDELAQEERRRVEASRRREEKELIHRITGMDLVRDDLVIFMTQARRDGEDFQPYLDALQAIDDLDLKRAGLTTWDVDLDEEEGDS